MANQQLQLFRTRRGPVARNGQGETFLLETPWDTLIVAEDLPERLTAAGERRQRLDSLPELELLAPIGAQQEVWAAGVTYYRSRDARIEEAQNAGGSFYDRVYTAERPELFFKATPHRVAGPGQAVAIRRDAQWSVPEPELALLITPRGRITGYTIGNDMSSRDIEGENPLYLPQAKVYDRSCAIGPGILVSSQPLAPATAIEMAILRAGATIFSGSTTLAAMKRHPASLVEFLYRETSFPGGCVLLTGTGIVPPAAFALQQGDEIRITIGPIGTLVNDVG